MIANKQNCTIILHPSHLSKTICSKHEGEFTSTLIICKKKIRNNQHNFLNNFWSYVVETNYRKLQFSPANLSGAALDSSRLGFREFSKLRERFAVF